MFTASERDSIERSTIIVADLQVDANFGLGLTVSSVDGVGVIVKSLMKNGPAERNGRLHVGDHINSIAGHSLEGATQADADWLIQQLQGNVRVVASRALSWKSDSELCPGRLSDYSKDTEFDSDGKELRDNGMLRRASVDSSDVDTVMSVELQDTSTCNIASTLSQPTTSECGNTNRETYGQ